MVPGAGLEPARSFPRGILSPLCLPIPPPGQGRGANNGGWGRNRTGVDGFAGRCITTLPPSQNYTRYKMKTPSLYSGLLGNYHACPGPDPGVITVQGIYLERETRLELATFTLAT